MKLLIAYDGSPCSDAAIADLQTAGLPAVAEALVLTVAEMSPQIPVAPYGAMVAVPGVLVSESFGKRTIERPLSAGSHDAGEPSGRPVAGGFSRMAC